MFWTTVFCILPILAAFGPPLLVLASRILQAQARINAERARQSAVDERLRLQREAAERKAELQRGALLLQQIKIDAERLKVDKLQRDLGLNSPEFQPKDYPQ